MTNNPDAEPRHVDVMAFGPGGHAQAQANYWRDAANDADAPAMIRHHCTRWATYWQRVADEWTRRNRDEDFGPDTQAPVDAIVDSQPEPKES